MLAQEPARLDGKLMVVLLYRRRAARQQFFHPADRLAGAKPRSWIKGAGPVKAILKGAVAHAVRIVAMADHGGLQLLLLVLAHPKEGGTLRGANPFMKVGGVIGRVQD